LGRDIGIQISNSSNGYVKPKKIQIKTRII